MERGDRWTVSVYEDMPEYEITLVDLAILSSGVGMLLFSTVFACRLLGIVNTLLFSSDDKDEAEEEDSELGVEFYD